VKSATLGVCAAYSRGAGFGSQPETADGPEFLAITDRKSPSRSWSVGSLRRENRPNGDRWGGGPLQARPGQARPSGMPVRGEASSPASPSSPESRFST